MPPSEYALKYEHWITAANELIRFDEIERALQLLELVPAIYRDQPIPEIEALKTQIRAALITPHAYLTSGLDSDVTVDKAKANIQGLLRGQIVIKEMQGNDWVHIVDMGPGEYWLPIGLDALGFRFTYWPLAFDQSAQKAAAKLLGTWVRSDTEPDRKTLFCCHEVIEHLPSTQDITIEALRHCGGWPDFVHLSTPLYTYDCSHTFEQWNKPCGLPHLRAYTPREFLREADKLFPGYNWEYATDAIQSLRGYKTGGPILEK